MAGKQYDVIGQRFLISMGIKFHKSVINFDFRFRVEKSIWPHLKGSNTFNSVPHKWGDTQKYFSGFFKMYIFKFQTWYDSNLLLLFYILILCKIFCTCLLSALHSPIRLNTSAWMYNI